MKSKCYNKKGKVLEYIYCDACGEFKDYTLLDDGDLLCSDCKLVVKSFSNTLIQPNE